MVWIVVAGIAGVAVALAVNSWVVTLARVESVSMQPTLNPGDRVVLVRLGEVSRGDVVGFDGRGSFVPLAHPKVTYLKRVIGLAGDRVTCCDEQGRVVVNGVALDEPYLAPGGTDDVRFDVIVPARAMWVMGDNRPESSDSRAYLGERGGGFVPTDRIVGRMVTP